MSSGTDSQDRFRRIYAANFEALLAYAVRRVEQPADAADVVAEAFLVAWRRSREIPPDDEARLWLYGVARRVLANHHRGADDRPAAVPATPSAAGPTTGGPSATRPSR